MGRGPAAALAAAAVLLALSPAVPAFLGRAPLVGALQAAGATPSPAVTDPDAPGPDATDPDAPARVGTGSGSASQASPTPAPTDLPPRSGTTASAPLRLEIPQIGLDVAVTPYTEEEVEAAGGAVKPPTLWTVSWWTGGGLPGTDAANTVYLYGHTWREPAVFNRIKELGPESLVHVTTVEGRLRYVVRDVLTVDKPDLPTSPEVSAAVPGRLVLIGCYRATGDEATTTANVVVVATLG